MTDSLPHGTILFENVTKRYPILRRHTPRTGSWLFSKAFEYFRREPFEAIHDVSFRIEPGDMVGFLGRNGAGKSTILKLISGIIEAEEGRITCSGKVASLLELGVGFHDDLSGIENIFYAATMMGLTRAQILDRLETIVAFSGIEPFLFEPVKHYSSGMYARLGLSVALHVDASIILMDEVLGVGDAEFQHRCFDKVLALNRAGVTIVLVSHEPVMLRDLCNRIFWMENGSIRAAGDPKVLYQQFSAAMSEVAAHDSKFHDPGEETRASLRSIDMPEEITNGDPVLIQFSFNTTEAALRVGVRMRWPDGKIIFEDISGTITAQDGVVATDYEIPSFPFGRGPAFIDLLALAATEDNPLAFIRDAKHINVLTPDFDIDHFVLIPKGEWTVQQIPPP